MAVQKAPRCVPHDNSIRSRAIDQFSYRSRDIFAAAARPQAATVEPSSSPASTPSQSAGLRRSFAQVVVGVSSSVEMAGAARPPASPGVIAVGLEPRFKPTDAALEASSGGPQGRWAWDIFAAAARPQAATVANSSLARQDGLPGASSPTTLPLQLPVEPPRGQALAVVEPAAQPQQTASPPPDRGSLGSFLDATIARSRQIENTETPNATTPVSSPELGYFSDDPEEDYVELNDDFIEKCNATTDARKIKKLLAEHAVRYKLSPDPKFATSPINIRDKDYDFSLDLSHIAIVEKTPFCGTEKESAVEHMTELSTLSSLFSDDVKMRTYFVAKIFPFSLKDDAKTWYNNLPPNSIKSPKELLDVFFRKYFPASVQHIALQRIYNFNQGDEEKLPEAWSRFCSLIRARPEHDLEKHDLLDIFYSGLTIESRAYLDSCAGCVFRKRTPDDAEELLAKISRNHDDWTTPEPTPTPILKKRGLIKLNDEDMREAKKSLKEKGIKSEDVKNLPPIEDICEIIPPSSMIEDPLYPEGHPKRIEQDSQRIEPNAHSRKKKKKKHKNVVESSEPVNDPNSISISDAETESGNEHDNDNDNDKNDTPDKEEVEEEPEKHAKNKKTKVDSNFLSTNLSNEVYEKFVVKEVFKGQERRMIYDQEESKA
ncbi:hypothetical protein QYE76_008911 [Lolium multiflorum]|uniref:Retrotransposon gag domain-containing protein n=1 Tax=Lolium multiflorum TaxID=4521 RepID=A0AAD8TU74_LOLMU|nr:hypothetical protein QYE76_008911 [Lolium multiflorum]